METITQKDRILKFKEYMGMSMRQFETQIGVSNGYFKSLNKKPGARVLEQLFKAFPNLNRLWVLTGDGDMIVPNVGGNTSISSVEIGSNNVNSVAGNFGTDYNEVIAVLRENINNLKNRIASLEVQIQNKDMQIDKLHSTISKLTDKL